MAKPTPDSSRPRLLVVELWGVGDLALAMPFLRAASERADVTLLAPPHAAPLLARFAPAVELIPFIAPWTAFTGKYRLRRWPWRDLARVRRELRARHFDVAVSARPDPRDHLLLWLSGARRRVGFPRAGSRLFLNQPLPAPTLLHRAEYWRSLGAALGWPVAPASSGGRSGEPGKKNRIIIHTGAARIVRRWPVDRYADIAARLRAAGWQVELIDDGRHDLPGLMEALSTADRFIGNDSGPGHLAALLGVPTFTVFGPQLPELFAPQHPQAAWIEGRPCPYKPCFDQCHYPAPHCLLDLSTDEVWDRVQSWLAAG